MNELISQLKPDQIAKHFNGSGFAASIISYPDSPCERNWCEAGHGHTPEEAFAIFNGVYLYSAHHMSEFKI